MLCDPGRGNPPHHHHHCQYYLAPTLWPPPRPPTTHPALLTSPDTPAPLSLTSHRGPFHLTVPLSRLLRLATALSSSRYRKSLYHYHIHHPALITSPDKPASSFLTPHQRSLSLKVLPLQATSEATTATILPS